MKYICIKNTHRFFPVWPRLYWKKKVYVWTAVLDESCKYAFNNDGMKSWNKLVGISNNINPRKDSVRFVWKWDLTNQFFRIAVYVERKAEFKNTIYEIGTVKPGEQFKVVFICFDGVTFAAINSSKSIWVPFDANDLTFRLNPYFGGQRKAPHFMTLKLKA